MGLGDKDRAVSGRRVDAAVLPRVKNLLRFAEEWSEGWRPPLDVLDDEQSETAGAGEQEEEEERQQLCRQQADASRWRTMLLADLPLYCPTSTVHIKAYVRQSAAARLHVYGQHQHAHESLSE